MSVFTNRFDASEDEADEYVAAVLGLLGERNPVDLLAALRSEVEELIRGVWEEDLRKPEAEGKWSMMDVILHLLDSEIAWGCRLRAVLAEDRPNLTGYDQDRWAENLNYEAADLDTSLHALFGLRRSHVALIRSLTEEQKQRVGIHSERGEESLELMIRLYAGHDLVHLRQLARIRDTVVDV